MKKLDSGKNPDFFKRVYAVVAEVPYGRVTTYGAIAHFIGAGRSARLVGWALNQSITAEGRDLPCHRVVNRLGQLTGKHYFGPGVMESLLKQEGVVFLHEDTVDIKKHFWNPADHLQII